MKLYSSIELVVYHHGSVVIDVGHVNHISWLETCWGLLIKVIKIIFWNFKISQNIYTLPASLFVFIQFIFIALPILSLSSCFVLIQEILYRCNELPLGLKTYLGTNASFILNVTKTHNKKMWAQWFISENSTSYKIIPQWFISLNNKTYIQYL